MTTEPSVKAQKIPEIKRLRVESAAPEGRSKVRGGEMSPGLPYSMAWDGIRDGRA
jgi:hypothetical protein